MSDIDLNTFVHEIETSLISDKKKCVRIAKGIRVFCRNRTDKIIVEVEIRWFGKRYCRRKTVSLNDCDILNELMVAVNWRDEKEKEIGKPRSEERLRSFCSVKNNIAYSPNLSYKEIGHINNTEKKRFYIAKCRNGKKISKKEFAIDDATGRLHAFEQAMSYSKRNKPFRKEIFIRRFHRIGIKPDYLKKLVDKIKDLMEDARLGKNIYEKIIKYIYFNHSAKYKRVPHLEVKIVFKDISSRKSFSFVDKEIEETLYEAFLYRKNFFKKHLMPDTESTVFNCCRTNTGFPGISRIYKKYKNGNSYLNYYVACKNSQGKNVENGFSVQKNGEIRALYLALMFYKNNHYLGQKNLYRFNFEKFKDISSKISRMDFFCSYLQGLFPYEKKESYNKNIARCVTLRKRTCGEMNIAVKVEHNGVFLRKCFHLYKYCNALDIFYKALDWRNDKRKEIKCVNKPGNIQTQNEITENVQNCEGISLKIIEYTESKKIYKLVYAECCDDSGKLLESRLLPTYQKHVTDIVYAFPC